MNNELKPCSVCRWSDEYFTMCKNCRKQLKKGNMICYSSWDPKYCKDVTMFDILETFSDEQKELIYLMFGLCADECVCDSAYEDTLDNISKFLKTLTIEQKKFIYLTLIACFEDSNLI